MVYVAPTTPAVGDLITAAQGATIAADVVTFGAGVIPVAPTTTATGGTASSGTTETRDAVLGNYVFTAVAGHRYSVILTGGYSNPNTASDTLETRVRNGGASTPTASSTLVAFTRFFAPVANAPTGLWVSGTFVPGAGTVTLGVFNVRIVGSGAVAQVGTRELYVVDLGTV